MTALVLVSACQGSSGGGGDDSKAGITVWVDAARLPAAKAYVKAHPDKKVNIVTYDGDGNGATTLQTKIQLWNRSGKGWPDVIFSQQVNDPVWMAKKPFEFAAPVEELIPETCGTSGRRPPPRSARSTARSTASRTTSPRSCSGSTRS